MNHFWKSLDFLGKNILFSRNILQLPQKCTKISRYRFVSTNSRSNRNFKGMLKIGLAGVTVGAVVGTGYSIHYLNQPRAHILDEETVINPIETVPKFTPTKSVSYLRGLDFML